MKPELTPEMFGAIAKTAQALTDGQATQLHVNQPRICDHCKDADKEAFPYHVEDEESHFWQDLCNDCFDKLKCKYFGEEDKFCKTCGSVMEWEQCWNGCEDGFFNMYDEDPLWFDEDDVEICEICNGMGGYWVCPNVENHAKTTEATK